MARETLDVTFSNADTTRLPDRLTEGAATLLDLRHRGTIEMIGEKLKIRRQGGYCALDIWVLLWLYLSAGATTGLRPFWDVLGPFSRRVAALAGRKKLPAPASVSRALDAVELSLLRPIAGWLLAGVAEIDTMLKHPVVQTTDAVGQGWHVFDLDPTVTTLRQRALPAGEDLPEPHRRAEDTGAPGYSGRKRGDVQFRRVTVQHAGSGTWVHAHLSPGNGEGVVDLEAALDTIVQTCARLGHPLSRTLVRKDGEYGNVPSFSACRQRGLPFITRLNRPALYEDPEVLSRLRDADWMLVPDSRSGPQRSAADIGLFTIHPGKKTRRPDGGTYEPVTIRVVASIFPKTGAAKRGKTIDGWQVELFAVDVPADAWPSADAVAAYFGRTGQENRFAQEDRELGLDRIISYHLPGQELATLVGLSIWNLRVVRGFELEPPPNVRPVQQLRQPQPDHRVPAQWPRDPVVLDTLAKLDWPTMLDKRPGWSWDGAAHELYCPDGRPVPLTSVREAAAEGERANIIFRRPWGGCEHCEARVGCFHSVRTGASKHAQFSVAAELGEMLSARLSTVRKTVPGRLGTVDEEPGKLVVLDAMFLPAAARQLFCATFLHASIRVAVELPKKKTELRLVANDSAHRQRRRKTWADNLARNALPPDARVRIEVAGGPALRRMLGDRHPTRTVVGGSG